MPAAALIVVGPGIEVKPVEGDPVRADRNRGEKGTNVAMKRFLSMPRYDGASRKRMKRGKSGEDSAIDPVRPIGAGPEKAYSIINDLIEPVVPVVQGQVATCGDYRRDSQESREGFRGIFSETQTEQLRAPSSPSSKFRPRAAIEDSRKQTAVHLRCGHPSRSGRPY
jgi:hypothetical protein